MAGFGKDYPIVIEDDDDALGRVNGLPRPASDTAVLFAQARPTTHHNRPSAARASVARHMAQYIDHIINPAIMNPMPTIPIAMDGIQQGDFLKGYYDNLLSNIAPLNTGLKIPYEAIIASKYRYAATDALVGQPNLPFAITYKYQNETLSLSGLNGQKVYLQQSGSETLAYAKAALSVTFGPEYSDNPLIQKANLKLKTQKKGIAAYAVYALARGFHCKFDKRGKMSTLETLFRDKMPLFYYGYVVPLVVTICMLLNVDEDTCIHATEVLQQSLDSFTRGNTKKTLKESGVWSVKFLKNHAHNTMDEAEMLRLTDGIEITIASIFRMLARDVTELAPSARWMVEADEIDGFKNRLELKCEGIPEGILIRRVV
jgi:hypothetical protein